MIRTQTIALILILHALLAFPAGQAVAAVGDHAWSRGFDVESKADLTPSGNVVMAGMFYTAIDFGGGPLVPSSPFGADMFVARFDAAGNHLHSFAIGGGQGHSVHVVRADPAGGVYVMGRIFSGTVDFGGGPLVASTSFYVVRFGAAGEHIFSGLYGDVEVADAEADDHGIVIVGATRTSADFGGGPLTTAGDTDALIARLDGTGNHVHSAIFGDQYAQYARAVGTDPLGRSVVAVQIAGSVDFGGGSLTPAGFGLALVAFDADGSHVRSSLIDGDFTSGITYNMHLDVNDAGDSVLAGELHGAADFGGGTLYTAGNTDVFVAIFDPDGAHRFSQSYGSASYQVVNSVTYTAAGSVLISGNFVNAIDFGGGALTAGATTPKLFLARLSASGVHESSTSYAAPFGAYSLISRTDDQDATLLAAVSSPDLDLGGGPLGEYYNFLGMLEGDASPSDVGDGGAPAVLADVRAYPNPFNPVVTLAFRLERPGPVEVLVHDLRGALVARLHRGELAAGAHAVTWLADGVPSGVYMASVRTAGTRYTKPVALVK